MSTIIDLLREQKSISVPEGRLEGGSYISTLVKCPVATRAAEVMDAMKAALEAVVARGDKLSPEEDEKIKLLVQSALSFAAEPLDLSVFEFQSKG
jgi:hypothetical protein